MPNPIKGPYYPTQKYGLTDFAKTAVGKAAYKNFPGGIHPGVDFGTKGKSLPVIATCDGEVTRASMDGGWGNHVVVKGSDGWGRQYCHLASISVQAGKIVKMGDELGKVGTTGASTGIHLHYGHRIQKGSGYEYRDPSAEVGV